MKMRHTGAMLAVALTTAGVVPAAQAGQPGVYMTEFLARTMGGNSDFFIELTNTASIAIDISGWGFSTVGSRGDGSKAQEWAVMPVSLQPLQPGESVFITSACDGTAACDSESGADYFWDTWNLPNTVKVIHVANDEYAYSLVGSYDDFQPSYQANVTENLQLRNASNQVVDQISYRVQISGASTTSLLSITPTNIEGYSYHVVDYNQLSGGHQDMTNWTISYVGDAAGSYMDIASENIGNPNDFVAANVPVPEPETYAMMLAGLGLVGVMARRRQRRGN